MNSKAEKLRDLLGYATNAIDEKYGIENINEEVSMETELYGKRSFILCTPIGFLELRITVWWGYKLSKVIDCHNILFSGAKNKTTDAMVGGWIERKEGSWVQGVGSRGLVNMYCSRCSQQDLDKIPTFESAKIGRVGKFYI